MDYSVLIENQCLPPIPVVISWFESKNLILEQFETYQKRSFRNRVYIAGPNGTQLLTVPLVKGKNQGQGIKDVKISYDEDWIVQWLLNIRSAYSNAPYYIYYIQDLEDILEQRFDTLWKLNNELLKWVLNILGSEIVVDVSTSYQRETKHNLVDSRNAFTPQNITKYSPARTYGQVFEAKNGFTPNLSILDLIMCCGIESSAYINSNRHKKRASNLYP